MNLPTKDLSFPPEVMAALGSYVYRLLDPRNGETFYIGKGKGNRVFTHIGGEAVAETDDLDARLDRIREIRNSGFTVQHVIHRHGLDDATAFEVEGALMDAYSGISNIAGGHGNRDRGVAHARQIIERYCAEDAIIEHKAIEINVALTADYRALYSATRFAWRLDKRRAEQAEIALAVTQGLIIGVFQIEKWLPATEENFPEFGEAAERPGRFGFVGVPAKGDLAAFYLRKKVPPKQRGAANPIRYHNI